MPTKDRSPADQAAFDFRMLVRNVGNDMVNAARYKDMDPAQIVRWCEFVVERAAENRAKHGEEKNQE